jgi:hypothetical protein
LGCKPDFRSILAISWASYWSPIRRFGSRFFRRALISPVSVRCRFMRRHSAGSSLTQPPSRNQPCSTIGKGGSDEHHPCP